MVSRGVSLGRSSRHKSRSWSILLWFGYEVFMAMRERFRYSRGVFGLPLGRMGCLEKHEIELALRFEYGRM